MNPAFIKEILKIGGQAGILWVAIWWLAKSLREQYEHRIKALEEGQKNRDSQYENRIEALEKASERCETERQRLSSEVVDIHKTQNSHNREEIRILHQLLDKKSD